ncbi:ribonuclease domain-containing protein [Pseudarthrobacter sp. AL07]|uniref:ribonuclease domain-containing protein n=1 Tax=unclassified Pseudarthrobacter TaxID=2647000 RepID=UPI00249AFE5B|nr:MULTISPECIES: ribonuclease domain-containing protein [unclassified Pseudarthrobacter]MDI3194285.1 ribonuclease domain-containing protein [Pseudarthrobacter sp. AL20]MDI3208352.1 ribonuclease domain-containing protein [Pseudarthrobacter sp. AL07]
MRNRSFALLLTVLLAIAVIAFGGSGLLDALTGGSTPAASSSAAPHPSALVPGPVEVPAPAVIPANPSGLPPVKESQLPAEARTILAAIRAGGPYRYSQDNKTFGNFERILPRQDSGYYREYTVPTPGESDRGARRIVTGSGGEKYYTQDHYDSFKFIAEGS